MKVIGGILLLFVFALSISAQKSLEKKCPKVSGGNFKTGNLGYPVDSPQSPIMQISIKKKNFNREFMLALVKRLRADYCNAPQISVVIYDDPKLAKDPGNLFKLIESRQKVILMRGFYNLDRATGKESLEFSTALGKPTNEVEIKFKDGEPVP